MPGAAAYGAAPVQGSQTNGLAVGALVCGILSVLLFWACFVGMVFGIVAVVLGFIGRNKANEMAGNGAGMALAGIITGALGVLAGAVVVVSVFILGDSLSDEYNSDPVDGICNEDRIWQDPDC